MRKLIAIISIILAVGLVGGGCYYLFFYETEPKLNAITITTQPDKKSYYEGEIFSPVGMVVTAKYTDKSTKNVYVADLVFKKEGLELTDTVFAVSYKDGDITKSANINLTVTELRYDFTTIARVNSLVQDLSPAFEYYPETWDNVKKTGVTNILIACQRAVILDEEVIEMLDAIDSVRDSAQDSEAGFTQELLTAFVEAEVPNEKKSVFLWELIVNVRDVTNQMLIESESSDKEEVLKYYDEFIAQGRENFIVSFTAFLDVAEVASNRAILIGGIATTIADGGASDITSELTENEFLDLVAELKKDTRDSLDILSPEVFYSVASLTKIFIPLCTKGLTDDYLLEERDYLLYNRLPYDMERMQYYAGAVAHTKSQMAIADPESPEYAILEESLQYAQENLDYYNAQVMNDIDEISRLNNLINKDYQSQVNTGIGEGIDEIISDYQKFLVSTKAAVNSIDDDMIIAVYTSLDNDESVDIDMMSIVLGKMLYAGFSAEGGLTRDSSKTLILKYVEFVADTFSHMTVATPPDFEDLVGDNVDQLIDDAYALSQIDDYDTVLEPEFEDNLVYLYVLRTFTPTYQFYVYSFKNDEGTELTYWTAKYENYYHTQLPRDIDDWYMIVSEADYGPTYEFSHVRAYIWEDFMWGYDYDNFQVYEPGYNLKDIAERSKASGANFIFVIILDEII